MYEQIKGKIVKVKVKGIFVIFRMLKITNNSLPRRISCVRGKDIPTSTPELGLCSPKCDPVGGEPTNYKYFQINHITKIGDIIGCQTFPYWDWPTVSSGHRTV